MKKIKLLCLCLVLGFSQHVNAEDYQNEINLITVSITRIVEKYKNEVEGAEVIAARMAQLNADVEEWFIGNAEGAADYLSRVDLSSGYTYNGTYFDNQRKYSIINTVKNLIAYLRRDDPAQRYYALVPQLNELIESFNALDKSKVDGATIAAFKQKLDAIGAGLKSAYEWREGFKAFKSRGYTYGIFNVESLKPHINQMFTYIIGFADKLQRN